MTAPCGICGRSPAGLYPAGRRCAACAPGGRLPSGWRPETERTRAVSRPGACRFCRRPSWHRDTLGAVHDCCLAWRHVIAAGYPCPACQVAEYVMKQPVTWPDGSPRQVRLPRLLPLPRFLPDGTPYVPFPALRQISGTSGTCGTRAGQTAVSGFRTPPGVPEPPEPAPARRQEEPAMPDDRAALADAALSAAARGWHVFPLRPGDKRPAFPRHAADKCDGTDPWCRHGHRGWEPRATTDPGRIRRAWLTAPYNVGIATGPSGLVVLDLDRPKPGEEPPPQRAAPGICDGADVLAALCEEHRQAFPSETFMVRTRRGGLHLYFTAPDGAGLRNTSGRTETGLGWLIDTRACGGYVVAAGSTVVAAEGTGRYEVTYDREPAALPGWLAGLLSADRFATPPIECQTAVSGHVSDLDRYMVSALKGEVERVSSAVEGGRNAALNKAAYNLGRLIGAGVLDDDTAARELYRAATPWFGIGDPPFTPADSIATIRSAIASGKRKPRQFDTLGEIAA